MLEGLRPGRREGILMCREGASSRGEYLISLHPSFALESVCLPM